MSERRPLPPAWEGVLLRLLVENTTDYAVFVLDLQGNVLTWNPQAERVLGYAEAEILGRSAALIFTPEDRAAGESEKELQRALRDGRAEDERWHVRKDGSRFWGSGVMTPLRDEAGQAQGFAKVMRDLTRRKLAEEALRESEERLRVALNAADMGTWLWRIPTDEQILDESLRRLMGLRPEEAVLTLDDFLRAVHPEDRPAVRAAFESSLRGRPDFSVEFRVVWPDGSLHWLKDQGKLFTDAQGRPQFMTGACVDVTARRRLEDELRQRAAELAEEGRRKDEFLAMLGHELRNPLAPIRSIIEVLRLEPDGDPKRERAYATIDRQVAHLTRLVDDLLDVSRITQGKIHLHREPLDLAGVVGQAVEMSRPFVEARDHECVVSLPLKPLWVEGDSVRLTQVLFNLLENAAKYTDPRGEIRLAVGREGGEAVVRVRDNGKGIPKELLPHVFDVFTQGERSLDRSQGGLGLGLTLARRLVEMHGGRIQAHSDGPGRGSEFVVRLPALAAPAAGAPRPPRPAAAAPAPLVDRVLVVDDNVDVAESLVMLLEGLARVTRTAHSGAQALEVARAFQPAVVFLDIGLPGMDGYEVARRLRREAGPDKALLVAVSGYGSEEDRRRSREAGFDRHLVKPVGRAEIEETLTSRVRPRPAQEAAR